MILLGLVDIYIRARSEQGFMHRLYTERPIVTSHMYTACQEHEKDFLGNDSFAYDMKKIIDKINEKLIEAGDEPVPTKCYSCDWTSDDKPVSYEEQ